jgi:hypothetical protein
MSTEMTWDGAAGWPRPRLARVPKDGTTGHAAACFVQSDPADPLSVDPDRLRTVFAQLECQVCGEAVLDIDDAGWVLTPKANMGGACCTRCMYLAVRVCPHLADAPNGSHLFWPVREARDYDWHVADGQVQGHILPNPKRTSPLDWRAFFDRYRSWKAAATVTAARR